jgi:GNAT superfamily N-acetyltransferase
MLLRPASRDDMTSIATIWHSGWADGHVGHVPAGLHEHRRLVDFTDRVPSRLAGTTVATLDSRLVGFVTVVDDEIEQLYVAADVRGSGVADALLRHGERTIARDHDLAWLAVVAGNARARRFYARHGWQDAGPIDYAAETRSGTVPVAAHRYEKHLGGAGADGS